MATTQEETREAFTVRLPGDLRQELREYRAFTGTPANDLIVRLIRDFLADKGREEMVQAMTDRARRMYGTALDELADK